MQVVSGIQKGRRNLDVPRPPVAVLPVLGRFDGRDEVDEAEKWKDRFARDLKPYYDDWLPKKFEVRQILEVTKIPYIAKFSFGEPLPVILHGITDPDYPGFYLDNIAELLFTDFQAASKIITSDDYEDIDKDSRRLIFDLLSKNLDVDLYRREQSECVNTFETPLLWNLCIVYRLSHPSWVG